MTATSAQTADARAQALIEAGCLICGRRYIGRSKPQWAFAHDGRLVGTVHTSCSVAKNLYWTANGSQSVEDARHFVWLWKVAWEGDRQAYEHTDQQMARILLSHGHDATINDRQTELLDWWLWQGPMNLGEDRRAGILRAYEQLLAEYREWRAGVPEDGTP